MKIKKVQLTEEDKRRAYRSAVRKVLKESGIEKITGTKVYRNKKRYTRKGKDQILREDEAKE
jgi:hypothetical protein